MTEGGESDMMCPLSRKRTSGATVDRDDGRPGPASAAQAPCRRGRRAHTRPRACVDCAQDFSAPTKIAIILIVIVIIPSADITTIEIANNARRGSGGGASPALILLTGETADSEGST